MNIMNDRRRSKIKFFAGYRVYPFRAIDNNSEKARQMAESPFVKEKLEKAKKFLEDHPIPDEIFEEMRQSRKKKR